MLAIITRTLTRLFGNIYLFSPKVWFPFLMQGIAVEFERLKVYRDKVLNSVVPHANMDTDSIEDYNNKYGIIQTTGGTNAQKIARIMERAALNGYPGKDWLQDQLQTAGFLLYVIENGLLTSSYNQIGTTDLQMGTTGFQMGLTARFADPALIAGSLIVSSPVTVGSRIYLSQIGLSQMGDTDFQMGTVDINALNPQPFLYLIGTQAKYWGFYFTLSPFADRVAVDESEFLTMTQSEYNYLVRTILGIKLITRNCILQAKAV